MFTIFKKIFLNINILIIDTACLQSNNKFYMKSVIIRGFLHKKNSDKLKNLHILCKTRRLNVYMVFIKFYI